MRVGALCAGIGGLELGVERALGAEVAWQCEIDPYATDVLSARFPQALWMSDLRAVPWESFANGPEVRGVDIVCFGFPCQDISSAGRRAGLEGEASGLWFDCADALRLVRPRYVLVENVGALLVRGFDRVLADLAEMGYVGRWGCLRSSDVGAPHRRERVFIAAALTDGERTGRHDRPVPRPAPLPRRPGTDVHAPVDGGATPADPDDRRRQEPVHDRAGARGRNAVPSSAAPADPDSPTRAAWDAEPGDGSTADVHRGAPQPGGRGRPPADPDGERLTLWPECDSDTFDAPEAHHQLDELDPDGRVRWGTYEPAIRRWEAIHGPAPRPRDDQGRLNPELPEWMLGFPAGWVNDLDIPRTAQLRLLGNAVQPQVAELATRLLLLPLLGSEAAA